MSGRKCKSRNAVFSIKLSDCPTCGAHYEHIAAPEHSHGHQPTKYAPLPPCEQPNCRQIAVCRSRLLGWVCHWHYEHEHQEAAREYAALHGLVTVDDHLQHGKMLARRFQANHVVNKPMPREPGED